MASDESLEELIAQSLSKKSKSSKKSFADLYDLGYEKNDSSINDDREVFDAAKALADDFKTDRQLAEYEDDASRALDEAVLLDSVLDGVQSSRIQQAANGELEASRALDPTIAAATGVTANNNSAYSSSNQGASSAAAPQNRAEAANTNGNKTMLTSNNRPAGHPVNRQRPTARLAGSSSNATASANGKRSAPSRRQSEQAGFGRQGKNGYYNGEDEPTSKKKSSDGGSSKRGKKKKKHVVRKIIIVLLIIIALLFGLISFLIFKYIGMMNLVETGERQELSVTLQSESYVKNILIIGSDTRNEESGRSDTMILVSINSKTKQIVQTSFMRDTLVTIPGYGQAKLNAAYAYGGAELVMDTLEQNFEIEIDKYVRIDFFSFVDIIDAVGGLTLTVDDSEAEAMTDPMNEINDILGRASGEGNLSSGGTYDMDGVQALAYARIRYAGDGDFDRTGRQREVVEELIEKFMSLSIFEMNTALETILPEITTNMEKSELYFLCLKLPFMLSYEMKQFRIPYGEQGEGYWSYGYLGSESVLEIDYDKNISLLKQVIFDGVDAEV